MNPSEATGSCRSREHGLGHRRRARSAPRRSARAGQDPSPQRQRAERLVGVDRAVERRQRAPRLDQVRRRRAGAWRGVRVGEGVGVLHDPGGQDGRDPRVDLDPELGQQHRHHLAGRGRIGVDPGRERPLPRRSRRGGRCSRSAPGTATPRSGGHRAGARQGPVEHDGDVGLELGAWCGPRRRAAAPRGPAAAGRRRRPPPASRVARRPSAARAPTRACRRQGSRGRCVTRAAPGWAADSGSRLTAVPLLELAEEAQDAVARLDRVVVPDDELRDVAQRQPPPSCRRSHGAADRSGPSSSAAARPVPEDAHPDLGACRGRAPSRRA